MSGTFNDIDVPPTLVSFAVDIASYKHIITPEFKKAGNKIVLMKLGRDEYDLPDYKEASDQYGKFFEDVKAGKIVSAYALDGNGIVPAVSITWIREMHLHRDLVLLLQKFRLTKWASCLSLTL